MVWTSNRQIMEDHHGYWEQEVHHSFARRGASNAWQAGAFWESGGSQDHAGAGFGEGGPGWTDERIAEALEVGVRMIENVRRRCVEEGPEAAAFRQEEMDRISG